MGQAYVTTCIAMAIRLFIVGLPPSYPEKELLQLFASYGTVLSAHLQRAGSVQYGYVTMASEHDADRAIRDLHRSVVGGQRVLVMKE